MDEALHFPGQEPEAPAPDPQPEPIAPAADTTPETPPEPKPDETPEPKPTDPADPEVLLPKKPRSIYDDLKDTRKEKNAFKDAAVAALEAQGVTLTGKETAEELQALAKKTPSHAPAPAAPATPSAPTDELEAYAQEHGLDATALARLAEVIGKRIPAAQLSEADRSELETLKGWKATKDAEEARAAEDREVLATAPTVKTQLEIHDDTELDVVMKEVVRLSHTPEFHDKEVDYIVWKNKDALSKLVSPKKPSFENGGSTAEAAAESEPDFSSGKGITPEMAQTASQGKGGSALEIRKGK